MERACDPSKQWTSSLGFGWDPLFHPGVGAHAGGGTLPPPGSLSENGANPKEPELKAQTRALGQSQGRRIQRYLNPIPRELPRHRSQ